MKSCEYSFSTSLKLECEAEEADVKIVRYALHCCQEEYSTVVVKTIDYDVLVLLLSHFGGGTTAIRSEFNLFADLSSHNSEKWYNVIDLSNEMGKSMCQGLLFFYTFTGCDNVSSFHGVGKCSWWDAWMKYFSKDALIDVFTKCSQQPDAISNDDIDLIADFVKSVYYPGESNYSLTSMANLRLKYFMNRADENLKKIGPSYAAPKKHVMRACYQSGYLWSECHSDIELPDPCQWGWKRNDANGLVPEWLPAGMDIVHEKLLTTCQCKTNKCKNCKCAKLKIQCLPLCKCFKECTRN